MTYDDPQTALREIFGYEEFRPGQGEVIESVLAGDDLLAIMPTGSGKSLCYQLPACMMEGTALVVSPLIALMKDQLDGLRKHGVDATLVNSSLTRHERRERVRRMQEGAFDLVYVAPERFRSDAFLSAAQNSNVSLLAIDEAHCISHWGHDFRPDYLALGDVRDLLDTPTVLALTATATKQVQNDILEQLGLDDADVILGGFERPNLHFEVFHGAGDRAKMQRLEEVFARDPSAPAVVYCATRNQVDEVSSGLEERDFVTGVYHGGLSARRRKETQDAFMAGDLPILVATNAFGMGVDKPDIRSIAHFNMPGSLEAYYQEAGRAGRDGKPAICMMLYQPSDRGIHDFFIENSYPEPAIIESVWKVVAGEGMGEHELSPEQIAEHVSRKGGGVNVHPWAVKTSLKQLREGGHVDFQWRRGRHFVEVKDRSRIRDLRVDWARLKEQRRVNEEHVEDVVKYARGKGCRSVNLLHYFGATPSFGDQCGRCDSCNGGSISISPARRERPETQDTPETIARKILSAAARAGGTATPIDIAATLRGSESERMERKGYTELSTHGILPHMSQHALVHSVRNCITTELLGEGNKSRVALTDVGIEVMKGETDVPFSLVDQIERLKEH